jgi:Sybindin-like family
MCHLWHVLMQYPCLAQRMLCANARLSNTSFTHSLSNFYASDAACSPVRRAPCQVAPIASSGIEKLETSTFKLRCLQTLTGAKFVITAQLNTSDLEIVLQGIYELYTDYVLKVRAAVYTGTALDRRLPVGLFSVFTSV